MTTSCCATSRRSVCATRLNMKANIAASSCRALDVTHSLNVKMSTEGTLGSRREGLCNPHHKREAHDAVSAAQRRG